MTKPTTTVDTSDPSFAYQDLILSNVSATGNVNGTYFLGNGSLLSGIITSVSSINNGTSNMSIPALNGNIVANVGGTTIATISSSVGLAVTGAVNATTTVSATGNITGGNITTAGILSATGNITGAANVSGGNLLTGGLFSAAGGITGGSVSTAGAVSATGNVTGGNVNTAGLVSAGANVVGGNIRTVGIVSATGAVYGDSFSAANGVSAGTTVAATTDVTAGGSVSAVGAVNSGGTISAVGNITGSYIFGNGSQLSGIDATSIQNGTSNVRVVSSGGNVAIGIGGTANVAVFATTGAFVTGLISATGNITGGNVLTGGLISATGNITGANVISSTTLSATANVVGGNISTAGLVTATGNVTGGNIITAAAVSAGGVISATGNVTGGNLITTGAISAGGIISATGNITGGNINTAGVMSATGNLTNGIANVLSGNAIITSLVSAATVSATGNVTGGNLNAAGLSLSGNVVSGLSMVTAITTTANISGGYFLGNGSQLTGIDATSIQNGTSNVRVVSSGGNVTVGVGGTANVAVFSTGGMSATGNITGGNVISGGARVYKYTASASVPSNAVAGDDWYATGTDKLYKYINDGTTNQWVDQSFPTSISTLAINGNLSVGGTLTANSITFSTGSVSVSGLLNAGANGVGNIGNTSTRFNTVFATTFSGISTTANYADLAENYQADGVYDPGTVVVFGGKNEITVSDIDHDTRIAGVVSTNPAYLMNSAQINGTPVALAGRVPCLVQGPVAKGDRLVNVALGVAGKFDPAKAELGCVVGKSLQDLEHDHVELIEIAVGRT